MDTPKATAGKVLRIDLTTRRCETMDTTGLTRRFLGGRGLATAIYHDEVPPEARFDDPENRLVVAVGPLSGIPGGIGGTRWGVFGKSPFPAAAEGGPDHFCYGNLGGSFGSELRYAGYDGIVVQGKADGPVAVTIADDRVEVVDATDLWGRTTVETIAGTKERAAPRSKVMAIGPAGEHLVPIATIFAEGDASCSGGMGAVMGAKRLKAIAVRGTSRSVAVADRDRLKELERRIRSAERGNVKVWGLDFMAHGPNIKKFACHGCMGNCLRVAYRAADGTRGKFMCQSRFFYMANAWGYYGEDNDVPFFANRRCDEYGIDTWEAQGLIEWLLLCHAQGALSVGDAGLDLAKIGSLEFIEDMLRITARREGFGELLALGPRGAARARGGRPGALFTRTDPYDPRYCAVNTLLFPFETREPIQQLHEAGLVLSQWSSWAKGTEGAHISSDVARGIAERFWGSAVAADMTTLDGKAVAARKIQDRQFAKEAMGLCDWMFPQIDVPKGDDHVGDPTLECRILSAVVGVEHSEADLYRIGERIFNLQRAVLLREGHRARTDDLLMPEWHERGIDTHPVDPDLLVPGAGGAVVSAVGRRVELPSFLRIRDEYYAERGWDVPTGLQSRQLLRALDLGDVADELATRGLLVERSRGVPIAARLRHAITLASERIERRRARNGAEGPKGTSVTGDELVALLAADVKRFNDPKVRHNFAGWTKTMQYTFTDTGEFYVIRFVDGVAQPPEKVAAPVARPEIGYEMNTWTLAAMSRGELSGEQAYLTRQLRMKAPFSDMMKLQAINKV
jgi:aldehyde:ferredoxin oxidoreductase